ncbi:MAG TPA: hypothetical protein VF077_07330 [Nitrospiraceae bacterium]
MRKTWNELATLPVGTRVVFDDFDIYPYCIVRAGTAGTITRNDLLDSFPILYVLPDDPAVREALSEWQGQVEFAPANGGEEFTDLSPLAVMEG